MSTGDEDWVSRRTGAPSQALCREVAQALTVLSQWAVAVSLEDLPGGVRERAASVLVDDLGAIMAGYTDAECMRLAQSMRKFGGRAESRLFDGNGELTDRYTAAMANAAAGTWCELDEGYRRTFCHAGIYILPALLAEAEATDASVASMVRALSLAYEIVTRIARAFPGTTSVLHPHGCFSALGGAAAVSLLGEDPPEMLARVLHSASWMVNPTPFDQAYSGALARNVFAAVGAGNGMRAAHWARLGVCALDTAATGVFAGGLGADVAANALVDAMGEDWAILSNFQRRFACCQFAHSTIEATLDLLSRMPEGYSVDAIDRIVVAIHPLGLNLQSVRPTTTLGARFSMPHITAACTRLGHADVSAFSLACINDADIAALRERVELQAYVPTPTPPMDRPARVSWYFADGLLLEAQCKSARGEPGQPLTSEEIFTKFETYARPHYGSLIAHAEGVLSQQPDVMAQSWRRIVKEDH